MLILLEYKLSPLIKYGCEVYANDGGILEAGSCECRIGVSYPRLFGFVITHRIRDNIYYHSYAAS